MSFYKRSHNANEIEAAVNESLPSPEMNDGKLDTALEFLVQAAEAFESLSMDEEAEITTQLLETIASGQFAMVKEAKKKAKKKAKSKRSKKKSPASKGLDADKMTKNLAEVGWVFNAPSAGDCGECSMADDDGPEVVEIVKEEEPLKMNKCKECGFDHALEMEKANGAHFPKPVGKYEVKILHKDEENDRDLEEGETEEVPADKEIEMLLNSIEV